MRYEKLGYIALNVTDIARSLAFYEQVVGLQYSGTNEQGHVFFRCSLDHHNIVLCPAQRPGLKRVGVEMQDEEALDELAAQLRRHDVRFHEVPQQECAAWHQGRTLRMSDPTTTTVFEFYSSLPKDVIELVVLFTAAHWKCRFEWAIHSEIGRKYGLGESTLEALHAGREPATMTPQQSAAWHFVRDVHRTGEASDASFAAAADQFGREGVLELVALCGYYSTLAMILNTARFLPEQGRVYPDA